MSALKNKSNNLVSLMLLLLVALTLWLVRGVGSGDWHLMLLTLAGVASGCLVLTLMRPQRIGLSPPNVMLSLGIGGMLLGLLWDGLQTPLGMIEALCVTSNEFDFLESMRFHMTLLPGMHVMMVAGGIAAIPTLRVLRLAPGESSRGCQILFIADSNPARIRRVLDEAGPGMLTVCDSLDGVALGAMVGIGVERQRLSFNIGQTAARSAGVGISSKLLRLAGSVR